MRSIEPIIDLLDGLPAQESISILVSCLLTKVASHWPDPADQDEMMKRLAEVMCDQIKVARMLEQHGSLPN